jgi:hypothetical protein
MKRLVCWALGHVWKHQYGSTNPYEVTIRCDRCRAMVRVRQMGPPGVA